MRRVQQRVEADTTGYGMNLIAIWNWKRTQDDRGQVIQCRALGEVQKQASLDPQLAVVCERAIALFTLNFTLWHGLLFGLSFGLVTMTSFALLGTGAAMWVIVPLNLCFFVVVITFSMRRWRKAMPNLTRIFIEEGICAGCAYTLESLEESDDGMLVCPECSAAWRRDRVLRFAPIAKLANPRTLIGEVTHFTRQITQGVQRRGIRDDRDSPRVVIALHAARKLRPARDHRQRLNAAVKTLRPLGRGNRVGLGVLFAFVSVFFLVPLVRNALFGVPPGLSSVLLALLGLFQILLAVSTLQGDTGRSSRDVWREFIKHDLCPSCAADLRDLSPADDGCTPCHQCSAAWRMHERKDTAHAPTPPPSP